MPPSISGFGAYAPFALLPGKSMAARPMPAQIARLASVALTEADKAKLAEQAKAAETLAQSMKTARDDARSNVKSRAKDTVQRLKDEYALIKKMWAHNPREMARQLSRIAKDLKSALSDYAKAAKANGERAVEARETLKTVAAEGAQADAAKPPVESAEKAPPVDAEAAKAVAAYETTVRERAQTELSSAEGEAQGDLEFAREVRGFVKELRKTLQEAKVKAAFLAPDKDRAEAIKAADKSMKEIDEALEDLEKDVKEDFPDLATGGGAAVRGVLA